MGYTCLSKYYDRLFDGLDYTAYLAFIAPRMGSKGLDLGCGTGHMTNLLAEHGVAMHGIDLSPDMLNVAVAAARKKGLQVLYRPGDLRSFPYTSPYDLITVVCDGLNYIPRAELPTVLARMADALAEGGTLVFDVSTPYKLQEVLGNELYFEDYDDLTYYWQNTLHPRTHSVDLALTFFERVGDVYRRADETQTQYWHTEAEIAAALNGAGLKVVRRVDEAFDAPTTTSLRWIYRVEHM